jgi:ribosomal protein S12 methylthiotransferase accessory factor YcaO
MGDDAAQKAILNGIAEGIERDADSIAKEGQQIRDAIQPLGRIVPEKEQEWLNTITASLNENVRQLRETAALLRKVELLM